MQDSNQPNKQEETKNTSSVATAKSCKKKEPFTKSLLDQIEIIVIFFAIIVLVFSFICKTCTVDGDSMVDTLHDKETVMIWSLFYEPDYEDIVVIHDNDTLKRPIVKRVIGLPGDTVYIEHYTNSMRVEITHSDGSKTELNEDYAHYDGLPLGYPPSQTYKVGDGEVFVMGDNRFDSLDSRILGCYDSRQILGKVIFRISPINKIGTVK